MKAIFGYQNVVEIVENTYSMLVEAFIDIVYLYKEKKKKNCEVTFLNKKVL